MLCAVAHKFVQSYFYFNIIYKYIYYIYLYKYIIIKKTRMHALHIHIPHTRESFQIRIYAYVYRRKSVHLCIHKCLGNDQLFNRVSI